MKITPQRTIALSVILVITLLGVRKTVKAQGVIYFPNSATVDYDLGRNNAYVGYANDTDYNNGTNGTSPTVAFLDGANIAGGGGIQVYNSSLVNFRGGNVYYTTLARNSSTINISGGTPSNVGAYDNSTINVSGGVLNTLSGINSSTVNVTGGTIAHDVEAYDSSTINMTGGSIGGRLIATTSASTVNLSGGSVAGDVNNASFGTINIRGGSISGSLFTSNGNINIFGENLSDTLIGYNSQGGYTQYTLSGALEDGTDVTGKSLNVGTNGHFTLNSMAAPEPGSGALLAGICLAGVSFCRRRHRSVVRRRHEGR